MWIYTPWTCVYWLYIFTYDYNCTGWNVVTGPLRYAERPVNPQRLVTVASLNEDFATLLLNVCQILSNCPDQQVNLGKCKEFGALLCVTPISDHSLFKNTKIENINNCENFKQLFEILRLHMSWDEHSILTQLVSNCNSVEGQQEITKFEKRVAMFQGLQMMSDMPEYNMSEEFARFCVIINKPYKDITIEEYEDVKSHICSTHNFNHFATVGFMRILSN